MNWGGGRVGLVLGTVAVFRFVFFGVFWGDLRGCSYLVGVFGGVQWCSALFRFVQRCSGVFRLGCLRLGRRAGWYAERWALARTFVLLRVE